MCRATRPLNSPGDFHKKILVSHICPPRAFPLQRGSAQQERKQLTDYYFWELDQFSAELPYICERHQINIGCIEVQQQPSSVKQNMHFFNEMLIHTKHCALHLQVESFRALDPTTPDPPAGPRLEPSAQSGIRLRSVNGSPRSSWQSWDLWRGTTSAGTQTTSLNHGVLLEKASGTMTSVTYPSAMPR